MLGLVVAMFAARQLASCKRLLKMLRRNGSQTEKIEAVCLLLLLVPSVVQLADADANAEPE
jgi:hypothetical protein